MLCQKCKKREANVFLSSTVNGITQKTALCSECTAREEIHIPEVMGFNLFENLFYPYRSELAASRETERERKTCPLCGMSLYELTEGGKAGCAKCYETYSDELSGMLRSIHGDVRHVGRRPKKLKGEK